MNRKNYKKPLFIIISIFTFWTNLSAGLNSYDETYRLKMAAVKTQYKYFGNTKKWLGNHDGIGLMIGGGYKCLTLDALFSISITNHSGNIAFDGDDDLPYYNLINDSKLKFDLGYEYELFYNFRIEPYIGYIINPINIVDPYTKHLAVFSGISTGIKLNKYFYTKQGMNVGVYLGLGYNTLNYRGLNTSLTPNNMELSLGFQWMFANYVNPSKKHRH